MIRVFSVLAIVLFIFSGCLKNNGKNDGNDNDDTTKQAYAADPSGSYSSASGTWAKAIRIQKDGKILVLGQQWFVRLEKDGVTVDNTFNPVNEIASSPQVNAFELQDDGKIIVFGQFVLSGGRKAIARLNTDGSLDESFHNPDLDINYQAQAINIHAVKLLANGKMIIAGAFSYRTPTSFGDGIARLNADQSLDYTFVSPIDIGDVYNITYMLPLSDGGFLLTGYGAIKLKDGVYYTVVKINADGVQDKSYVFDSGGLLNVSSVVCGDMKELSGGKVLIAWNSGHVQDFFSHLARLNADGSVDAAFKVFDLGGYISSLLVLPDNNILVGNEPDGNLPNEKKYLSYLNSTGKEDTASSLKLSLNSAVYCLANLDETTVLVGGNLYYNDKKYAVIRLKKNK